MMEKTDEILIERVNQAHKQRLQIMQEEKINNEYGKQLPKIAKENRRHLKNARKVPREFVHEYAMDQQQEASVSVSEEEEEEGHNDFKVDDQEIPEKSEKSSTIGENYQQTIELVKKYIRVDIPGVAAGEILSDHHTVDYE